MSGEVNFHEPWAYSTEIGSVNPSEVSCETLFSQLGYASNLRRAGLDSQQLMPHNHCLQPRYYVFDEDNVVHTFLKYEKNNHLDE